MSHPDQSREPQTSPRLMRRKRGLFAVLALASTSIASVLACGPFFPEQLLDDRKATLENLPVFSFAQEVVRLLPPAPAPIERASAGSTQPTAQALYDRGANAFRDAQSLDHGLADFEAISHLPEAGTDGVRVKAAFMSGRVHEVLAFAEGQHAEPELAAAARDFALTRQLVAQGWSDPDGLDAASWGEEARLALHTPDGLCGWGEITRHEACERDLTSEQISRALELYLHQAVAGGSSGVDSLSFLLEWISRHPAHLKALAQERLGRDLLSLYVLAYDDGTEPAHAAMRGLAQSASGRKAAPGEKNDLLALAAYRLDQFELAAAFAGDDPAPYAAWVRAKLAIRANDLAGAARAYAQAIKGFPTNTPSGDAAISSRIRSESGVLKLSRGEFVQAFITLFDAAQGDGVYDDGVADASYLAERVLTVDELRAEIDRAIPASPKPPPTHDGASLPPITRGDIMRHILARRLVREGRLEESLAYFPEDDDPRYGWRTEDGRTIFQPFRQWVRAYAKALDDARSRWTRVSRAQGWFEAANLVRIYGMEIMGTEQGPDYAAYGGAYAGGAGRSLYSSDAQDVPEGSLTAQQRADRALKGPFITPDERKRYAESDVTPYARYHYRWVAVGYAEKAADLLPPRSQAFAAVLCQAASWQTDRTSLLYARYLRQGALVSFGRDFGNRCEVAPDFDAARHFALHTRWRRLRERIARHL
ncbi:hypothetical protein [Asaia krungthepensis]|uniref:Uncharacterized protein n=1 Tax=Asaia krungthepensis NRIC 0535 TaxID=1307925 RepID=A0ABQ0Q6B6_9PROT|nr:hypothetical protein [Asaia krungthepensis]GBQ93276.1 hypothetical protein AA0535_2790 [Asaia krungthepensis NRIC 0535]